jgi:integrase
MARRKKGTLVTIPDKNGGPPTYALRVPVPGRPYETLGKVSRDEAERQREHILADVERGIWKPRPRTPPPSPEAMPTFEAYVEERWWPTHRVRLIKASQRIYRGHLKHLIPFFGQMLLDQITPETVGRYQAAKVEEAEKIRAAAERGKPLMEAVRARPTASGQRGLYQRRRTSLSPHSINCTTQLLAEILWVAVEDDLITRNPAGNKKHKLKEKAPHRPRLERPAQMEALLDAAGELDRESHPCANHYFRRAMIATLMFAGLRISEMLNLRWSRVNLPSGYLTVGESKTDAGSYRQVRIRDGLRDELLAVKAQGDGEGLVFPARSGRAIDQRNFAPQLQAAVERANEKLAAEELPPLPEKLTSHFGRRTFVMNCCALREDIGTCMDEVGHTNASFTLKVYREPSRLSADEKAALRKLVEGEQILADIGINADEPAPADRPPRAE